MSLDLQTSVHVEWLWVVGSLKLKGSAVSVTGQWEREWAAASTQVIEQPETHNFMAPVLSDVWIFLITWSSAAEHGSGMR